MSQIATIWARQKPGTDVAWINGLLHVIVRDGLMKTEFIDSRTEGVEEVEKLVAAYTPERVSEITGVAADLIVEAARLYATAERASIVYSMGITQHTTGVDNVRQLPTPGARGPGNHLRTRHRRCLSDGLRLDI